MLSHVQKTGVRTRFHTPRNADDGFAQARVRVLCKWEGCCFRAVSIAGFPTPAPPRSGYCVAQRNRGAPGLRYGVGGAVDGFAVTSAPDGGRPYHGRRRLTVTAVEGVETRQQTVAAIL